MDAGRQAHRPDPPARGVRQHLLRRPQAQPPVHGREPVALRRVYRHARRSTGLTRCATAELRRTRSLYGGKAPPSLPSLRANGSRECAPDYRLREAIHGSAQFDMDCFVAALLAMTRKQKALATLPKSKA